MTRDLTSAFVLALRVFGAESPIAVGLVELDGGERATFYTWRRWGGLTLDVDGVSMRVLTPAFPLGRALARTDVSGDVDVRTPHGLRQYSAATVV